MVLSVAVVCTAMLSLNQQISDSPGQWSDSPHSMQSNGAAKTYSLSAPSSTLMQSKQWRENVSNHFHTASLSPSPEVVPHPESNILDLHDDLQRMVSLSREEELELELEREMSVSRSSLCCAHRDVKSERVLVKTLDVICGGAPPPPPPPLDSAGKENGKCDSKMDSVVDSGSEKMEDETESIRSDLRAPKSMENAKSTPVTISDFLGLNGMALGGMVSDIDIDYVETKIQQNESQQKGLIEGMVMDDGAQSSKHGHGDACYSSLSDSHLDDLERMQPDEPFEVAFFDETEDAEKREDVQNGTSPSGGDPDGADANCKVNVGTTRAERLSAVCSLFDGIYRRVMDGEDPPVFYAQSVQLIDAGRGDADEIDFVSSEQYASYFGNPQSEPYKNIATYLKSMLPAALVGHSGPGTVDEYDDNE